MGFRTINVEAEVDLYDVLDSADLDDVIDWVEDNGYSVIDKEGNDTMSLPQNINSTTYNKTELRKLLYDIAEVSYCTDVSEVLEKIKALVI